LKIVTKQVFGHESEVIKWAPHSTKGRGSSDVVELVRKHKKRIFSLYRSDFETFSYSFDDCP
ncbi:MAG: hypothetical protein WBA76_02770, partial [Phormidesmis sp.]